MIENERASILPDVMFFGNEIPTQEVCYVIGGKRGSPRVTLFCTYGVSRLR